MLWILRLLRTKLRAVATYLVRGVTITLGCALCAGVLTVAAAIAVAYFSLWQQTGLQPPWPVMAGLISLSAPLAMSVMGVVSLLGLLRLGVGAVVRLLRSPEVPSDPLHRAQRLLETQSRPVGPPITLIDQ